MGWRDSFVPDQQAPVATQAQGWRSSFVPDNPPEVLPSLPNQSLPGEEFFNQVGLAGRDLAGAVPMAIASIGDAANTGINYFTGSDLGKNNSMPTDYIQNGLSATGLFPEYQNKTQKDVGNAASVIFGGGQDLYNLGKQAYGNAVEMFPKRIAQTDGTIVPKSGDLKLIKEKLGMAGITPQQYAEALAKSSSDDFAGELGGDALRMQTQAQAKVTGPAMQEARDAMRERLAAAPQRTAAIIGENIKPAPNVENMLGNIDDMQKQLPGLYEAAYKETAPSIILSNIMSRPAAQKALAATAEKLSNQGVLPLESGLVKKSDGSWKFTPDVPVKTIDEFQRSLGDLVQRNPITGAVEGSEAATIEGLRKQVTSSLASHSKLYEKALNIAAAKQQAESAFEMGRQLAKSSAGEKADALMDRAADVMSPNELSYQRAGYAQGLTDATQGAPLGGSPASRIATGKVQNTVGSILEDSTKAQKFAEALMQEKNRIELAQRGLGGSNTAETLTSGVPEVPTSLHGVVRHTLSKVQDMAQAGKNARIAQLLYATDPEQKAILARKLLER